MSVNRADVNAGKHAQPQHAAVHAPPQDTAGHAQAQHTAVHAPPELEVPIHYGRHSPVHCGATQTSALNDAEVPMNV